MCMTERAVSLLVVTGALSTIACARAARPPAEAAANEAEPTNLSCRDNEALSEVARAESHDVSEAANDRLPPRRSISLGETWVPPRWLMYRAGMMPMSPVMPMMGMPPAVVINNYNQVTGATPGYGGSVVSPYYYPSMAYQVPSTWRSSSSSVGAASTTSNATPRLGGDWPTVPSYGPKMSTQTSPAAVWPR
jgi:hypothetical protein